MVHGSRLCLPGVLGVLTLTALACSSSSSGDEFGTIGGRGGAPGVSLGGGMGGQGAGLGSANGWAAGGSGGAVGSIVTKECASTTATSVDEVGKRPADIIIAVDSSGSMKTEIGFVQDNLNRFSEQIVAAGIDARVILIGAPKAICIDAPLGSGQCPGDSNPPRFVHVDQAVGSNDALNVIVDSYSLWRQHLRPEATKSFFVVTDDDATDAPLSSSSAFRQAIHGLDPAGFQHWTMNAVYCFTMCKGSGGEALAAAVGEVYRTLVVETQGVAGDLCLQDFQPVFNRLATQIVQGSTSRITCEWPFPTPPAGQTFSPELVEVRRTTSSGSTTLPRVGSAAECAASMSGWYFDHPTSPSKIVACPETCSALQGERGAVDVVFACELVEGCAATGSASVSSMQGGLACDWPLPAPPAGQRLDIGAVNVRFESASGTATTIGKVSSAADCSAAMGGWYFDDASNPTRMHVCSETCELLRSAGNAGEIEVLFGCKSVEQPVPR